MASVRRDFRMTKWHRRIFALIARFDYLTITDFYVLLNIGRDHNSDHENQRRYLRAALKDLAVAHKMLGRFEIRDPIKQDALTKEKGTTIRRPHYEFIYWLTRKGSETILEFDSQFPAGDTSRLDPKGHRNPHDKKSGQLLPHDRERTRFFRYLEQATDNQVWRRHLDLRHSFNDGNESLVLIPDDVFFFGGYYRFLELERSQKEFERADGTGIVDKLRKYHVYADPEQRRFLQKWNYTDPSGDVICVNDFYVNVVMLTEERKSNLLREMNKRGLAQSRFQVTSLEAYIKEPAKLLEPIWHTYDGKIHSLMGAV